MKTYKHEPGDPFEGFVEIEVPTYKERLSIIRELGVIDEKSAVQNSDKIVGLLEKHIKTVALKHGTMVINNFDELGIYQEGMEVINNLTGILVGGIPLGGPSKQP